MNSSATLYVCDLHRPYLDARPNVKTLEHRCDLLFTALGICLVPLYNGADSIINLVQQLNGLLSMPILSAFLVRLLFRHIHPSAIIFAVIFGTCLYALFTFVGAFALHSSNVYYTLGLYFLCTFGQSCCFRMAGAVGMARYQAHFVSPCTRINVKV